MMDRNASWELWLISPTMYTQGSIFIKEQDILFRIIVQVGTFHDNPRDGSKPNCEARNTVCE